VKNGIFITGTDTGVGKTVVTGLLGNYLNKKRIRVITQKWVQTGCHSFSEDIVKHLELMNKKRSYIENYIDEVAPCILKFPASPHLAAKLENLGIDISSIEKSYKRLADDFETVLVEGAGGILVPVNEEVLVVDIVQKLNLSVLIVAENRLGAINQTLMTVGELKARGINILGIIFNQVSKEESEIVLKDNPKIVEKFSQVEVLGELPFVKKVEDLSEVFSDIGEKILKKLY